MSDLEGDIAVGMSRVLGVDLEPIGPVEMKGITRKVVAYRLG